MKLNSFGKISTMLVLCLLGFASEALAQQRVSGTVTDKATGEPLVGVSVAVKGTTKGVISDVDGKYSADVAPDATLVFGYLGYKDVTVGVEGRAVINVTMESDINKLDEVVMVGYSSVKKTELSSAVTTVQGDKLRDVTTPDLGSMLQGKVAGVQVTNSSGAPGSTATISESAERAVSRPAPTHSMLWTVLSAAHSILTTWRASPSLRMPARLVSTERQAPAESSLSPQSTPRPDRNLS